MTTQAVAVGYRAYVVGCLLALILALPVHGGELLIRDVTLIDGTGAPAVRGASVLVINGRIASISVDVPEAATDGVEIISGEGRYLLPGLIDAHVHLQGGRLPLEGGGSYIDRNLALRTLAGYLYSGVTSIYDAGNNADFIFGLREEERAGTITSPRVFATGANITVPGGYADNEFSLKVSDPADLGEIGRHFERRPDVQKLLYERQGTFGRPELPVPSGDQLAAVMALAREHGIPTTAHAVTEEAARSMLEAGVDSLAHPVRTGGGDLVQDLVARGTPVVTTLAVMYHIATVARDPSFLDTPLFAATVEPEELERQKHEERERYVRSGMAGQFSLLYPIAEATIAQWHRAGVVLALGTDRTWGPAVQLELELLHRAGIPLQDLPVIASRNAAAFLGLEMDLGTLEPGKLADMILLEENPLESVTAYNAIAEVFKEGRRIDRSRLKVPANDGAAAR